MKRNGLTLIEILVALTLMVLVVSLAYVLYESVSRVQLFQQEKSTPTSKTVSALQTLSSDLNNSVYVSNPHCVFRITETNGYPALSFCTTIHELGESDLRWHGLVATKYWVSKERAKLIRTQQPLVGPGAFLDSVTNVLLAGVSAFSVGAYDGEEWSEEWEAEDFRDWPEAARLELGLGVEEAESTQVLIPFGTVVESQLIRQ